jgi:hypothetical protein
MLVRSPRARRWLGILSVATPLLLSGCKKTGDTALGTPGDGTVAADPLVVVGDQAVKTPAALLPATTVLMVSAASPNRIAQALERERLLDAFGAQAKMAVGFLSGQLGFDPFDPAAYPALGIDADGPIGFAVIDASAGAFALFGTVTDVAKLKAAARDMAGRQRVELTEQVFGSATLMRDPKDARGQGLVIRDKVAAFVIVGREAPVDYAERMAKQPVADSLARSRGYRRAMGSYDTGDLLIFADAAAVVEQAASAQDRKASTSWAADELAAAKEREAPAEEIERLQAQAAEIEASEARWRRQDEAAGRLASMVALGVEGTAWRLSAKSSGVFLEGRVALGPDAFLRSAVRNTAGRSLFATSLSGEPAFVLEGAVDPAAAQQIVELLLEAEGSSWLEVSNDLQKEAELSLDNDIWPLWVGDGGIAITFDEPLDFARPEEAAKKIGLAIRARVKDPAAAAALLEKLDASSTDLGRRMSKDADGYVLDIPDYRKLHVELAGDHLLLATDKQLGVRLSHGSRGLMGRQTDPPEAWAAMMMPDRAGIFAFDVRAMGWLMIGRMGAESMSASISDDDVPMSRAAKAKLKEIEALDAKIAKASDERARAEFEQISTMLNPFGITVVTAAMDDRGIDIVGGQLTRDANVSQLLESMVGLAVNGMEPRGGNDDKVFKLFEDRRKLQDEFEALRQADRDRVNAKSRGGRKPGSKKPQPTK